MTFLNTCVAFDENAIGPSLTLTAADTTLTPATTVDIHRMCRSVYPVLSTQSSVEFYIWSPTGNGVSSNCYLGVVDTQASQAKYVGEDSHGYGLNLADGKIYNGGVAIATLSAVPLRSFVTVVYDPVIGVITWMAGTTVLGSVIIGGPKAMYYAATVAGNLNDLAVWANSGQTPFTNPVNTTGWQHLQTGINPINIATECFTSASTDAQPYRQYLGDWQRGSSVSRVPRSLDFWPWGNSKPPSLGSSGNIQISLNDPNHIYDQLMQLDIRDQLVRIGRTLQYKTVDADGEWMFYGILDRCEQPTDQTKLLYCNDILSLLQQQPYRPLYPPDADASCAGKPKQISIGPNRTYQGANFDTTSNYYGCHDAVLSAVGKARIAGKELALGIDYFSLPSGDGFSFPGAPTGVPTFETTDYGGSFSLSSTDILNGDGNFAVAGGFGGAPKASATSITIGTGSKVFTTAVPRATTDFTAGKPVKILSTGSGATMTGTVTSYNSLTGALTVNVTSTTGSGAHTDWSILGGCGQPTNWTGAGGYGSQDGRNTFFQQSGGAIIQNQTADAVYTLNHQSVTIAAGASAAVQVAITQVPYYGPGVDAQNNPITISPSQLVMGGFPNSDSNQWIYFRHWCTPVDIVQTGNITLSFTNNEASARPFTLGWLCNNMINGTGGVFSSLGISSVKLVSLPALAANVVLGGPPLARIVSQLLVDRGPLTSSQVDTAAAAAIDAITGYIYSLHVSHNDTPDVDTMLKAVTQTACVDRFSKRSGAVSFAQLIAPESVAAANIAGSLVARVDFKTGTQVWQDMAENLTTRMSGCRNIDKLSMSDFNDVSISEVPLIVRALLTQDFQWTVVAGAQLASRYVHAANAKPYESWFDRQADGQAEISRVCSLYSVPRNFYQMDVFNLIGRTYELGQIWNVTDPQVPTLKSGTQLMLVGCDDAITEGYSTLTFWGL